MLINVEGMLNLPRSLFGSFYSKCRGHLLIKTRRGLHSKRPAQAKATVRLPRANRPIARAYYTCAITHRRVALRARELLHKSNYECKDSIDVPSLYQQADRIG